MLQKPQIYLYCHKLFLFLLTFKYVSQNASYTAVHVSIIIFEIVLSPALNEKDKLWNVSPEIEMRKSRYLEQNKYIQCCLLFELRIFLLDSFISYHSQS